MARMPEAELAVTAELAKRLLADQFSDLAALPIRPLSSGWDNVVFRLGDDYLLRLPRRKAAVQLIEHEQRWLHLIAERVRVPIPVPLRHGVPTVYYPWPWSVVPWIGGTNAAELDPDLRTSFAADLAAFIGQLHTSAPEDAPVNAVRGVPLRNRATAVEERLGSGTIPRSGELLELWRRLSTVEPWAHAPVWLHGDLHPANLLSSGGRLSGVIDFGDVTSGDPATDLSVAWLAFDPEGRNIFFGNLPQTYREDHALMERARAWALVLATAFANHSDDNPSMAAIGTHAIGQLLDHVEE